ncbi:MAG TPA: hypothetical protein VG166_11590 [Caulobacteraceae bacterium]|jgi:hypothetical protein|nr:hypothetical protein [Caulobacteraceae bacterium]
MNYIALARAAKICALVGFLLPWVVVSCSGSAVQSDSGLSLARGHPDHNWWLILAMAAIVAGLMFSFYPKEAAIKARALLIAAIVAALLIGAGVAKTWLDYRHHLARAPSDRQVVRFETRFGLWLTLASLAAAAGLSGAALSGRGRADGS